VTILAPIKFILFLSLMFIFVIHHELIKFSRKGDDLTDYYLQSISNYARIALKILNVSTEFDNYEAIKKRLIVANHLSYLDVLVLFEAYPSLFITSVEMGNFPVLGRITRLAGCFYVERRKSLLTPERAKLEIETMTKELELGRNVFLFPEGTSTDGSGVLPFKAAIFQLAIDTKTPVVPLCLEYEELDSVPWHGEMTFLGHLFKLCLKEEVHARVTQLTERCAVGKDRFGLAKECREAVALVYGKKTISETSSSGLAPYPSLL
jgi:1-acyl-sn-glycerol-3-phosphate acyltransferase